MRSREWHTLMAVADTAVELSSERSHQPAFGARGDNPPGCGSVTIPETGVPMCHRLLKDDGSRHTFLQMCRERYSDTR